MLKLGRPPRKFTAEEAAEIYNSGKTFKEVAQILSEKYHEEISESTVRRRLKEECVKVEKRRPMTDYERQLKFKEKRKASK